MDKTLGKKRGRPRKPVLVVRLTDVQPAWEERLRRAGNPKEKNSDYEISETSLPPMTLDASGRRIRPTKRTLDSLGTPSFTQPDPVLSLLEMAAAGSRSCLVLTPPQAAILEVDGVPL
jgi:hypothetical protein